ncbi:trypsin-like peptidase domain-containing protein [Candidatus Woesearchaeota archaeon]|nr:trypsin-like peptidase domain-containing protein [Candidatus Woesearchaeota archaeon]
MGEHTGLKAVALAGVLGAAAYVGLSVSDLREKSEQLQRSSSRQQVSLEQAQEKVASLEHRLEIQGAQHVQERAEMDNFLRQIMQVNTQLQNAQEQTDSAQDSRLAGIESILPDKATLAGFMRPVVQVNAFGGVGAGSMVYSEPKGADWDVYVLTAYHVVRKALKKVDGAETRAKPTLTLYSDDGSTEEVLAELLSYNKRLDLAVLVARVKHPVATAKLASREHAVNAGMHDYVTAVGCPLNNPPYPTYGRITSVRKEVRHSPDGKPAKAGAGKDEDDGEMSATFFMIDAPTIFGNSGGPVYDNRSGEQICIVNMVSVYDNFVATAVPHMGVASRPTDILDWVDSQQLPFLHDPSKTPQECYAKFAALQKEKPDAVCNTRWVREQPQPALQCAPK